MAETILTPGQDNNSTEVQTSTVTPNYLIKDNFLSEFSTESEKSVARYNLGVPASEDVYTKEEVEPVIIDRIKRKINETLDSSDFITREVVEALLAEFVRIDGSTPFTATLTGIDPKANHDLVTKVYVDRLILECLKLADKSAILEQIANILKDYAKEEDVYTKEKVYTKSEIDDLNTLYVKADGTVPFEKPVSGRTPQIGSHLTTKKYVDDVLLTHKEDIDPHGFTEKLINKLKKYALKDSVYDKTQTYSRGLVDSIIDRLVTIAVEEALSLHTGQNDPHEIILKINDLGYVKADGTIAFNKELLGVDAETEKGLTTLRLVTALTDDLESKINKVDNTTAWITSGPVLTTVGFVEDNTDLSERVTLQEILDAIFYGASVNIVAPNNCILGETVDVMACLRGAIANLDYAEVYQNGELLYTLTTADFEDGNCATLTSWEINCDTTFELYVYYLNGASHYAKTVTKVAYPVFIGIIPKWKAGNTLTYSYLNELIEFDDVNNKFYPMSEDMDSLEHQYDFKDSSLNKLILVLPASYPDLRNLSTLSQLFTSDAFDIIDMIPMSIPGADSDVIYKCYIYKEALVLLSIPVTYNF